MAYKVCCLLVNILIIVSLVQVFAKSSSSSSSSTSARSDLQKEDYDKWLSWNVENHSTKRSKLISSEANYNALSDTTTNLDEKLTNAEMNKLRITVGQDGISDFPTINEALKTIPKRNTQRVVLAIKPGIYREKILIPKTMSFITFFGDAGDPPVITGNDTASTTGSNGKPMKTFSSATVAIDADYFVAVNVRFENTAPHVVGFQKGQAVAVRVSGNKASFYNCSFYGIQDTLYDHRGLHYFNNCFIQGSVDFIFGYGRSFYEKCHMNSTAKKVAFLTAQKRTSRSMESGFSIKDSVVSGSGRLYLGRAWGDYSRVVFSYTLMDSVVLPQGWSDWGRGHHKREMKVYYGEYKCSGVGANMTGRVEWARMLSDQEAQPFIGTYYVDGDTWLINPNNYIN